MTEYDDNMGQLNLPFVGIELCEVVPDDDRTRTTTRPAVQLLLNLPGRILHFR